MLTDPNVTTSLTVADHIDNYVPWLSWTRGVAESVLPIEFSDKLFSMPTLSLLPLRALLALFLSWGAFALSRRL